jgi:hypothetical protein
VSSFGTDAAMGDSDTLAGKWDEYLLASRATTIYGGTSEVQLNIIAERLLGCRATRRPARTARPSREIHSRTGFWSGHGADA